MIFSNIWNKVIIKYLTLIWNLPPNDENHQILYQKHYHLLAKIIETKRITIEGIKNHPWFNLIDKSKNMNISIMNNSDIFPVDEKIII